MSSAAKGLLRIIFWILICIVIFLIISMCIFTYTSSLYCVREGELVKSSTSPDGNCKVNVYIIKGNATTLDNLRAETVIGNKTKTIFYQMEVYSIDEDFPKVEWIDNETITINGITLNVLNETYNESPSAWTQFKNVFLWWIYD